MRVEFEMSGKWYAVTRGRFGALTVEVYIRRLCPSSCAKKIMVEVERIF